MAIDEARLNDRLGRFVGDFGAALHASTVIVGEKLGPYKAMADAGPLAPRELGERTATNERYVAEWLAAQAASGYVDHDAESGRYRLSAEQAYALADKTRPAYIPSAFLIAASLFKDEPTIIEPAGGPPALAPKFPLTGREHEVLRWVAAGKTDRDIGDILAISHRTVHKHLQRVYGKLGVETRTAAVMRALAVA